MVYLIIFIFVYILNIRNWLIFEKRNWEILNVIFDGKIVFNVFIKNINIIFRVFIDIIII